MVFSKFADYYDLIYRRYDYDKECRFIMSKFRELRQGKVNSIIDLGCGTGTHDIILSSNGFNVVGIDVSEGMVRYAREKARTQGAEVDFLVQDMRELNVPMEFDCALCLFGGFGYLLSQKDLEHLFAGLRTTLKPSALLMFEFGNVEGLKPTPYRSWDIAEGTDLRVVRLSRSDYDYVEKLLRIHFKFLVLGQGSIQDEFDETHVIRIYSTDEIQALLEREGFRIIQQIVGYAQQDKPIEDKFRVFVIAELDAKLLS